MRGAAAAFGARASGAALALASLLPASPASALTRDEVAKKYAPVFFQEVRDKRDLQTAYDFDGNWAGDDNGENVSCVDDPGSCAATSPCKGGGCKLVGTVYYTVIETWSHWFVQYLPYHPLDVKVTNGHEHDTETVFVAVAKNVGGKDALQVMETQFHGSWFTYADASVTANAKAPDGPIHVDATGHPMVYQQQVGHGICGGFSAPNYLFPDLQLTCDHAATPHVDRTGVVYRPDLPAAEPVVLDGKAVEAGYAMVEILTSFWARKSEVGPGKTYKELVDFDGERCDVLACPKQFGGPLMGDEGDSPSFPWNQASGPGVDATGDQFFDPAFTMSRRLTFPQPIALEYCHNPYVGIVAGCSEDNPIPPETPAAAPASSPPPPEPTTSAPVDGEPAAQTGCACSQTKTADAGNAPAAFGMLYVAAIAAALSRRSSGTRRP
jgi:hypothetical protein